MKKLRLTEAKGWVVPMACPVGFWYVTDDFPASKLDREKGVDAFKQGGERRPDRDRTGRAEMMSLT